MPRNAYEILTASLSDDERKELAAMGEQRVFNASEAIFCEGKPAPGLVLVHEGWVIVAKRDESGHDQTLANLYAPTVLGELELVTGGMCQATVSAVGEVRAEVVNSERFNALLEGGSVLAGKIMRNIARVLAERLNALNTDYVDLSIWRG
jgi:CRP-like cAMP-binding protein